MKKTGFIRMCVVLCFFTACDAAWAATVYLKDRSVVTGEIAEETELYLKIIVNGSPQIYVNEEIEKVEKDNVPPEDGKGMFVNQKFGFSFRVPPVWEERPRFMSGKLDREISFEQNFSRKSKEQIPFTILLVSDPFEKGNPDDTPSTIVMRNAKRFMEESIAFEKAGGAVTTVLEGPREADTGKVAAGTFIVKCSAVGRGAGNARADDLQLIGYVYMLPEQGKMLTLSFYVHSDQRLADEKREIESVIASLRLPSGGTIGEGGKNE